jgi:hypothetical protein
MTCNHPPKRHCRCVTGLALVHVSSGETNAELTQHLATPVDDTANCSLIAPPLVIGTRDPVLTRRVISSRVCCFQLEATAINELCPPWFVIVDLYFNYPHQTSKNLHLNAQHPVWYIPALRREPVDIPGISGSFPRRRELAQRSNGDRARCGTQVEINTMTIYDIAGIRFN